MLSLLIGMNLSNVSVAAAPAVPATRSFGSLDLLPVPVLAQDPWQRRWAPVSGWSQGASLGTSRGWSHGPDGPDDVPEDGYGFKASKKDKKGLLWAGMGAMAVGGIAAASARSQSFVMREAQTLSDLDASYEKQRKLAYASYGFLGAGALCMILEIPF